MSKLSVLIARRSPVLDDTTARLLVLVLQALFELLVPHSLGLAAREILIALCLAGSLWLLNRVRDMRGRPGARGIQPSRPRLSTLLAATT